MFNDHRHYTGHSIRVTVMHFEQDLHKTPGINYKDPNIIGLLLNILNEVFGLFPIRSRLSSSISRIPQGIADVKLNYSQFWIFINLFLIFRLTMRTWNVVSATFNEYPKSRRRVNNVSSAKHVTAITCKMLCLANDLCKAVNYFHGKRQCNLKGTTSRKLEPNPGSIHYEINGRCN